MHVSPQRHGILQQPLTHIRWAQEIHQQLLHTPAINVWKASPDAADSADLWRHRLGQSGKMCLALWNCMTVYRRWSAQIVDNHLCSWLWSPAWWFMCTVKPVFFFFFNLVISPHQIEVVRRKSCSAIVTEKIWLQHLGIRLWSLVTRHLKSKPTH